MATVNKDFKIKQGLVVEGATGTINGENILTEGAGDAYILDLIGGETLINSVDANDFTVTAGNLTIAAGSDIARDGDITTAIDALTTSDIEEGTNQYFTSQRALDATNSAYDAAGSASDAQTAAETFATNAINALTTSDIEEGTNLYFTNQRALDATSSAYDPAGSASTAQSNAEDYADGLINDASNLSTEVWSAYKTGTEISVAQTAAQDYADAAVADLVGSAPAVLDTIQELATALENNPDIIADLENVAAGKQDTLTAGSNIDITGATISVTGLDTADVAEDASRLYFTNQRALDATSAAYDAAGSAATAEQNAKDYADALDTDDVAEGTTNLYFTNQRAIDAVGGTIGDQIDLLDTDDIEEGSTNLYFTDSRAKTSAADLLTGASLTNITITGTGAGLTITAENGVADSDTDDLAEGTGNLYFTDERAIDAVSAADIYPNAVIINNLTKQVANQVTVATAGIATGISWAKADYRSAEFVVKVAYGDHTEISKVLMTLDVNDNIAITEYGNVTTNGSASTVSADISGTDARLRVTTVNNNSTVTVLGTLIA